MTTDTGEESHQSSSQEGYQQEGSEQEGSQQDVPKEHQYDPQDPQHNISQQHVHQQDHHLQQQQQHHIPQLESQQQQQQQEEDNQQFSQQVLSQQDFSQQDFSQQMHQQDLHHADPEQFLSQQMPEQVSSQQQPPQQQQEPPQQQQQQQSMSSQLPGDDKGLLLPISRESPCEKLFRHSQEQLYLAPPVHLRDSSRAYPIPTNKWFGNLLSGEATSLLFSVWTNPYSIKVQTKDTPFGLGACFPFQYRDFGPRNENGAVKFYQHAQINDACLSAAEFQMGNADGPEFYVDSWDDLGVQVSLQNQSARLQSYLASGMAFVTATYTGGVHPTFSTTHAIMDINGYSGAYLAPGGKFSGSKFRIHLNNGQRWMLYAIDTVISFTLVSAQILQSSDMFNGTIRIAILPPECDDSLYDPYVGCVLTSSRLFVPDKYSYGFKFQVARSSVDSTFLHFALPHHVDTLDGLFATPLEILRMSSTTRGIMCAFASRVDTNTEQATWLFHESTDMPIRFDPPKHNPPDHLVTDYELHSHLQKDIDAIAPLAPDSSYYFNGKAAMKYALLGLVAKHLSSPHLDDWREKFRTCVLATLSQNAFAYPLVYDSVYKGIVSSQGFATKDKQADFGNTTYNDHHFHYGYWIAACAIGWYLRDPSKEPHDDQQLWDSVKTFVESLLRDVSNPSYDDGHFPVFRCFDWYSGHSYAHGVTPMADGKDQESTSEEANFHYAVCLWGKATNNSHLESLGELMLKINMRSVNRYFLIQENNDIHPPEFRANKVTGIFFDNKCDYTTWFGSNKSYIHGIQMLPFTYITPSLRPLNFIQEEWNSILRNLEEVTNVECESSWSSILLCNYASLDRARALERLKECRVLDDGLSRTWALYYALTCGLQNSS